MKKKIGPNDGIKLVSGAFMRGGVDDLSENDEMRRKELNWVVAMIVSTKNHHWGGMDEESFNPPLQRWFSCSSPLVCSSKAAESSFKDSTF